MLKAMSFLGINNNYETVTYQYNDKKFTTHLFPEAVASFLNLEKIYLLLTEEALKHKNFSELQERLQNKVEIIKILIPSKFKTQEELWKFFDIILENIEPHDEVILDITNGFRSTPLLTFIAVSYLRTARDIKVRNILYGAYDAIDDNKIAPVFDLTPFADLLSWSSAVEFLKRKDDAKLLSQLLKNAHNIPWRTNSKFKPENIKNIAIALKNLSQNITVANPIETSKNATSLISDIPKVTEEINQFAKPFSFLLEEVAEEYKALSLKDPEELNMENLKMQIKLIKRFFDKDHIIQGFTLTREWLVNFMTLRCIEKGVELNWLERKDRKKIEDCLNSLNSKKNKDKNNSLLQDFNVDKKLIKIFEAQDNFESIINLWDEIITIRNTLSHCSMNSSAIKSDKIVAKMQNFPDLEAILNKAFC